MTTTNKMLYTARMFPHRDNWYGNNVWAFFDKDNKIFHAQRAYDSDKGIKPTQIFIYGKGCIKNKFKTELISLNKDINSYEDIQELVHQYGYKVTLYLLGFDEQSDGNAYSIDEIRSLENPENLILFNTLAEIDFKFKEYAETTYGIKFRTNSGILNYDLWYERGKDNTYQTNFRTNPFLGFSAIETRLMGMFVYPNPVIDPISWEKELIQFYHMAKIDEINHEKYSEQLDEVDNWYNSMSLQDHMTRFAGKELTKRFMELIVK